MGKADVSGAWCLEVEGVTFISLRVCNGVTGGIRERGVVNGDCCGSINGPRRYGFSTDGTSKKSEDSVLLHLSPLQIGTKLV